ncbi:MAG TPA: peptide deformylase [Patescibacteria group bacterium]|nr:peptide deformylase [Patescibacteria group bacterium]
MTKIWKPIKPPFAKHKAKILLEAVETGKFIFQIGEYDLIRKPSADVSVDKIKSKEIQKKIKYLKDCLVKFRKITGHGRGVTGVQVGIPERISVFWIEDKFIITINPKITNKSNKLYIYPEMCMSALPVIAPVVRPAWVEVEYYDENGVRQVWNTKDDTQPHIMMNRVLQHEIDHMNGIINIDLVKNPNELFLESDPKFYHEAKFEEVS